jgi:hypothetical protein
MVNFVLFSFGNEVEYKRAVFSVLSFWCWNADPTSYRVIIYTDNIAYFAQYLSEFEITYVHISIAEIEEINNKSGLIYRSKIAVIDKTFNLYPEDKLCYIDTDTFFISHPDHLAHAIVEGKSVMHLREYTLEDAIDIYRWMNTNSLNAQEFPRSFIRHIESRTFTIGEKQEKFTRQHYIWNAGVLGLNNEIAPYIKDVFTLSDDFYEKTKWRVSEQMAFTLVLGAVTQLQESAESINHYWHYKDRIDPRIAEILSGSFTELSKDEKIHVIRKTVDKFSKLLLFESLATKTKDAFREKDYSSGISFALKALGRTPLNDDFIKIIKYRVGSLMGKRV